MMKLNQHTFVAQCLERYKEEGAHPGDGDQWDWAHYPAPKGLGDQQIRLRHSDHQIQGLLQSVEYNQRCFFVGDAKRFLLNSPFIEEWFDLWDIYERFKGTSLAEFHSEKDEEGKSIRALEQMKQLHQEKDEQGRSRHAVRMGKAAHTEKNEDGKSTHAVKQFSELDADGISVHARRMAAAAHSERDESGRSLLGLQNAERIHRDRTEDGRSAVAQRAGAASKKLCQKAITVIDTWSQTVIHACSLSDMSRHLGTDVRPLAQGKRQIIKHRYILWKPQTV